MSHVDFEDYVEMEPDYDNWTVPFASFAPVDIILFICAMICFTKFIKSLKARA